MEYFQVRYDSRVVIYDRRGFIRLATGRWIEPRVGYLSILFVSYKSRKNQIVRGKSISEAFCLLVTYLLTYLDAPKITLNIIPLSINQSHKNKIFSLIILLIQVFQKCTVLYSPFRTIGHRVINECCITDPSREVGLSF